MTIALPPEVIAAIVGGLALLVVEMYRTRRTTQQVAQQVTPNHGTSMRDAVNRIESDVREMRGEVSEHGERLATLEAAVGKRWGWRRG